jgi:hypothetical protein
VPFPAADSTPFPGRDRLHACLDGFDLQVRRRIPANDRRQLERTLRYASASGFPRTA